MFSIGPYAIRSRVVLAPMAGVTDAPFRELCQRMGAGLTTSEMVTCNTELWHSHKSRQRLVFNATAAIPNSVQIAGSDPDMMAEAAQAAVATGAQIVDINMGCPAKKVCKKLAGSALLKDEILVAEILRRVVASVAVPVTLKIRTGWDTEHRNGVRIAKIAEDCGVQALAVHGRTRACRFLGEAEYDTIAEIVQAVSLPVIANGDIDSPAKALRVLRHTGANALMIGRGAYGNPWIFKHIADTLANPNATWQAPTEHEVKSVMEAHFKELYKFYGDYTGTRIARKHFAWYCQQHLRQDSDETKKSSSTGVKTFNSLETSQSQIEAVRALTLRPTHYEEKVA